MSPAVLMIMMSSLGKRSQISSISNEDGPIKTFFLHPLNVGGSEPSGKHTKCHFSIRAAVKCLASLGNSHYTNRRDQWQETHLLGFVGLVCYIGVGRCLFLTVFIYIVFSLYLSGHGMSPK